MLEFLLKKKDEENYTNWTVADCKWVSDESRVNLKSTDDREDYGEELEKDTLAAQVFQRSSLMVDHCRGEVFVLMSAQSESLNLGKSQWMLYTT